MMLIDWITTFLKGEAVRYPNSKHYETRKPLEHAALYASYDT